MSIFGGMWSYLEQALRMSKVWQEEYLSEIEKQTEEKEEYETTSIPSVGLWSDFKYLYKPKNTGIESVDLDYSSIYFTVPCGIDFEDGMKLWYLTFPLNGVEKDIQEFSTDYTKFFK